MIDSRYELARSGVEVSFVDFFEGSLVLADADQSWNHQKVVVDLRAKGERKAKEWKWVGDGWRRDSGSLGGK